MDQVKKGGYDQVKVIPEIAMIDVRWDQQNKSDLEPFGIKHPRLHYESWGMTNPRKLQVREGVYQDGVEVGQHLVTFEIQPQWDERSGWWWGGRRVEATQ